MDSFEEFDAVEYHNQKFAELPKWIKELSKVELLKILNDEGVDLIKEAYEKDPAAWYAPYHFNWGMKIRNYLRDNVCLDDVLPNGQWDDYYTQLVEYVIGVRK